MGEFFKSKTFWLIFILTLAAVFVAGMSSSRVFKSEMDILFIPKSEKAVRNIDQIISNAREIPTALSFYDKMLELNGDIEDGAAGLPDYKRKLFWNEKLSVEKNKSSGFLAVSVLDSNQWQAEVISRQVANDIVAVMSRYYDTKNDLDIRVTDGPIVSQTLKWPVAGWALLAIAAGIFLGVPVSWLVNYFLMRKSASGRREKMTMPRAFSISWEKAFPFGKGEAQPEKPDPFIPKTKERLEVEREFSAPKMADKKIIAEKKEAVARGITKKASVPANLPIAEEFHLPISEFRKEEIKKVETEKKEELKSTREATPEEVRERLNKLLRGEM